MIQEPLPRIIPATIEDYPTIQNMARFYVYDLSRDCGFISDDWALPANGLYESFDFKHYFQDPTRKAYLIKIKNELAGFVLLNHATTSPHSEWNIGEFFVLAKFQGKRIGKEVAHQVWTMHPGLWEVSVIPENRNALAFWRNIVSDFTGGKYGDEIKDVDFDAHQPKRCVLSFDTKEYLKLYPSDAVIRQAVTHDIPVIVESFAQHHWPKPSSTFEKYLQEQYTSERLIWVAHVQNQFVGYITLKWQSNYRPFRMNKIPEIMDLNVLPPFRKRGIGSKLLEIAETAASEQSNVVGIGVGLYDGYGEAQKLYIKRGYIPDGRGITYNYKPIVPGSTITLDDDLVLWFTKKLK